MVQEKLKGIPGKAKDWWKAATKKMKILLGSVLLAVLIVIGVITAVTLKQPYSVLFTGLSQTEMTEIVSYLSDNGRDRLPDQRQRHHYGAVKSGISAQGGSRLAGLPDVGIRPFHLF